MFTAKYVIIDGSAIVFFEGIQHSNMVRDYEKCDGAGFVKFHPYKDENGIDKIKAVCYGESFSLGIISRGEIDSYIVTNQLCKN